MDTNAYNGNTNIHIQKKAKKTCGKNLTCRITCTSNEMVCDMRLMGSLRMLKSARATNAFLASRMCSGEDTIYVAKVAKVT
jgi:hypothetical protein